MRCVMMMQKKCQTQEWVVVRKWQGVKWNGWIKSKNENDGEAKNTKRSDDPLKSNMKWSHIVNECNDGNDNDTKILRERSLISFSKYTTKWIQKMEDLGKLTYELSSANILNQVALKHQYTHLMTENIMHVHTCSYFSFLFIHFHFFLHIYKCTHNPKRWYQWWIDTLSSAKVTKSLSKEMTFSN